MVAGVGEEEFLKGVGGGAWQHTPEAQILGKLKAVSGVLGAALPSASLSRAWEGRCGLLSRETHSWELGCEGEPAGGDATPPGQGSGWRQE